MDSATATPAPLTPRDAPTATLGPYQLITLLSAGRTTEVWLAKMIGEHGFEKRVALKVLRRDAALRRDAMAAFTAEAALAARLYHPAIVQLIDVGQVNGIRYAAMEHVDGCSLRTLMRGAQARDPACPARLIARVVLQLCEALVYAHALPVPGGAGIVHGAIDLDNVVVARSGAVKLVDFGSARVITTPEGRATDIHALGLLLHDCLAGEGQGERDGAALTARAPAALVRVTLQAIAARTARHPVSAAEIARLLQQYLDEEPVRARQAVEADPLFRAALDPADNAAGPVPVERPRSGERFAPDEADANDDVTQKVVTTGIARAKEVAGSIEDLLHILRVSAPQVLGASVVSGDGLTVASTLPADVDEALLAGLAASVHGLGRRIATDVLHAELEHTYVRSSRGLFVIHPVSRDASLVLLVSPDAKLGMVLLQVREASTTLARYLS